MVTVLKTPAGKLRLLGIVALLGIILFSVEAISRKFGGTDLLGRESTSSAGCSCHGGSNTATSLAASSATGSFTVEPGSTTNFTVNVSNSSQSSAGVAIAVRTSATGSTDAGTLGVATGSGLQTVSSEITHSAPKALSGGTAGFTFSWTAPSAHGRYYIQAAGNAVNDNNANTGDQWNFMTAQEIQVAGITLGAPNGGATYCAGSTLTISWTSTAVTNVKIELSSDGGASWPTTLNASVSSGTNGSGSYSWAIPANQAAGTSYRIRVSDAATATRLDASDASFTIATAPSITTQPAAQTVCAGDPVTFSVTAAGSTPSYQWRRNGTAISGATSASYSIATTSIGDAGSYDVQVTNSCSTATSSAVALVVNAAPAITTQPTAQTTCVGQPATFTVQATGTGLSYQWRKAGAPIAGATAASYTIASPTSADAASYDVVVSGNCSPARTSTAVALTVRELPAITGQPTGATVCAGQPVSLSVSATGAGLSYQWRRNGTAITGATGATYSLGPASTANAGTYDVVVSGACAPSVTSTPVTLAVNPTPAFSTEPMSQTACEGSSVTLTASASGSGVTYRWRHNGVDIPGATAASFTIASVGSTDLGAYDVVATAGDCFSISNTALLGMLRPASITGQPTDKSGVVGSTIELAVTASGDELLYQWKKNGTNLPGETSARLTLVGVQTANAGVYTVEVRNACTTLTSTPATVTVLQPGAGAVLSLTPSTVDFGAARVGAQRERTLSGIISNAGDSVLTITAATLGGSSDFAFTALALPMSIPPGESRPLTVRFTPSSIGPRSATISFVSNSKTAASLSLLGHGAVGSLTTVAPSIGFGVVAPGATADTTLELCNNSEIAVAVSSFAFAAQGFSVVEPLALPVSVEPGSCLTVKVRFAPTAEGPVGDVLTIATDGEPANVTIGFSGTGGTPSAAPLESVVAASRVVASLRAMPNPATDLVTLALSLARPASIELTIVDARGSIVRHCDVQGTATERRFVWDGRTDGGVPVAAGTYRAVARAGGQVITTPIAIVR